MNTTWETGQTRTAAGSGRTRKRTLAAISLVTATLAFSAATVAPAVAGDREVIRRGNCSGSADWKLKAKADDGRIEVEGEIDSNVSGQVWTWKFKHNGSVSARGTKKTGGRSGSFEVERRMANLSGKDHFVFRAEHRNQVCRGTISY